MAQPTVANDNLTAVNEGDNLAVGLPTTSGCRLDAHTRYKFVPAAFVNGFARRLDQDGRTLFVSAAPA